MTVYAYIVQYFEISSRLGLGYIFLTLLIHDERKPISYTPTLARQTVKRERVIMVYWVYVVAI